MSENMMHVSESRIFLFPGWGGEREKKKRKKDGKDGQEVLCLLRMIDRALFIWPLKL